MFSGESVPVVMKAKKYIISDILDWFGNDTEFFDETPDEVTVRVTVNEQAMRHWGLQYARHARILSPQSLAEQIRKDLQTATENYRK